MQKCFRKQWSCYLLRGSKRVIIGIKRGSDTTRRFTGSRVQRRLLLSPLCARPFMLFTVTTTLDGGQRSSLRPSVSWRVPRLLSTRRLRRVSISTGGCRQRTPEASFTLKQVLACFALQNRQKKCIFSPPVCGGLRAHQGRQLQEEGGSGWGGGPDRHSGHSRPGGLRCHQGQLFPQRGGLPAGVLHHRARVLLGHCGVQVLCPAHICLCVGPKNNINVKCMLMLKYLCSNHYLTHSMLYVRKCFKLFQGFLLTTGLPENKELIIHYEITWSFFF